MNTVSLVGRIANDVEVRYTPTGVAMTNLVLAIDRPTKEKKTDFPRVTVIGSQAENIEKMVGGKGKRIAIEGRLETSTYQKNGETIYSTSVFAERVEFIDYKNEPKANKDPEPNLENIDIIIPF